MCWQQISFEPQNDHIFNDGMEIPDLALCSVLTYDSHVLLKLCRIQANAFQGRS